MERNEFLYSGHWHNLLHLDVNSGPLSVCRHESRPNLGIISVRRTWGHGVGSFVCWVGNAFTHLFVPAQGSGGTHSPNWGASELSLLRQSCAGGASI